MRTPSLLRGAGLVVVSVSWLSAAAGAPPRAASLPPHDAVVPAVAYAAPDTPSAVRPVNWFTELPGVRTVADKMKPAPGGNYTSAADLPEEPVQEGKKPEPSPELYLSLGRLSEQAGKLGDAEQQYQHALRMAPNHADTLLAYGLLKDRQGQLDEACRLLAQSAAARPEHAATHNALGLCYAKRRMYQEAITALNRAVQLDPKQPLYRNNVATVLVHIGDIETAFAHLTAVHGEAAAFYNLGYLLNKKGDSTLAAEMFAKALERDPNFAQARVWLARINEQLAARAAASNMAAAAPPSFNAAPVPGGPALSAAIPQAGPPATWAPGPMPGVPSPAMPTPSYSGGPGAEMENAPLPPAVSRLPSVDGPSFPTQARVPPLLPGSPYPPRTALRPAPGTSRY